MCKQVKFRRGRKPEAFLSSPVTVNKQASRIFFSGTTAVNIHAKSWMVQAFVHRRY